MMWFEIFLSNPSYLLSLSSSSPSISLSSLLHLSSSSPSMSPPLSSSLLLSSLQLLGRSIDLNSLLGQRLGSNLLKAIDLAISKFEASNLCGIMVSQYSVWSMSLLHHDIAVISAYKLLFQLRCNPFSAANVVTPPSPSFLTCAFSSSPPMPHDSSPLLFPCPLHPSLPPHTPSPLLGTFLPST